MTDDPQPLSFDLTLNGPEAVLVVSGELDPHTAEDLTAALAEVAEREDIKRVVLDLAAVTFIDSSGLRSILTAHDALRGREALLTLRSPSNTVHRLLEITDLLDHLDIER